MSASGDERQDLLNLYKDLRIVDIYAAMDKIMRHHNGTISPNIRPLFHSQAIGFAKTIRYLPYTGTTPVLSHTSYNEWVEWYYREVCPYSWLNDINRGDFCVIDQSNLEAGLMGVHTALAGFKKGACGYITNGGVRDVDAVIEHKIPFWSRYVSSCIASGRLRFDAQDISVVIDDVVIHPGDIIIAEGKQIIVVPSKIAFDVVDFVLYGQKQGRR